MIDDMMLNANAQPRAVRCFTGATVLCKIFEVLLHGNKKSQSSRRRTLKQGRKQACRVWSAPEHLLTFFIKSTYSIQQPSMNTKPIIVLSPIASSSDFSCLSFSLS